MAQEEIWVREVRLVLATDAQNMTRTDIHWMDRVANSLAQVQNTVTAAEFLDEDGHILRKVQIGEPSPEMQSIIDFEFSDAEAVGA